MMLVHTHIYIYIYTYIAACFGGENINGQYSVNWRTRGDRVVFRLSAQTQGWVGIGFSTNSLKVKNFIN